MLARALFTAFLAVAGVAAQSPLTPNVGETNTVARFAFQYYYLDITADIKNYFGLNLTSTVGAAYLYMNIGSLPSLTNYTRADVTPTTNERHLLISNPVAQRYYIGVYGYVDSSFKIVAGTQGVYPMTDRQQVTDDVAYAAYNVYKFPLPSGVSLLELVCNRVSASGDPDQYLSFNAVPTVATHDYANTTSTVASCIKLSNPRNGEWFYAVYGHSAAKYTTELILNGNGSCNLQTSGGQSVKLTGDLVGSYHPAPTFDGSNPRPQTPKFPKVAGSV